MKISYISIFPEIFKSFLATSLIAKAQEKELLSFECVNPRTFCKDKHKQVDDEIYGWWTGLLMKSQPLIDAVELAIKTNKLSKRCRRRRIVFLSPSKEIFCQKYAHEFVKMKHIIFVCARYEWIDYRFEQYMTDNYPKHFAKVSLGKFITLGGEVPAMTMTESIVRLIPKVIKEENSRKDESYSIEKDMNNLEYPQYTRPETVQWYKVPEILLSGHTKKIEEWKKDNTISL
jgi:tRNA (guanine37-N1)-methyltransferase